MTSEEFPKTSRHAWPHFAKSKPYANDYGKSSRNNSGKNGTTSGISSFPPPALVFKCIRLLFDGRYCPYRNPEGNRAESVKRNRKTLVAWLLAIETQNSSAINDSSKLKHFANLSRTKARNKRNCSRRRGERCHCASYY